MLQTFYKESDEWYIDLPEYLEAGGEQGDLQMVAGADRMLDLLSGNGSRISLDISKEECPHILRLVLIHEMGEDGADYTAFYQGDEFAVWLCAVTLYVFHEYPGVLYVNIHREPA